VTGASKGIGEATALRLDRAGFRVFAGVRKSADGDALARRTSGRLEPVILDVTDAASIETAVRIVSRAVGDAGICGLVNNAGTAVAGPLEFLAIAELRRQLEINVIGQLAVTQAFLPLLRKGRGRIVNLGSVSGRVASPLIGAYAASKFALVALTDALRVELHGSGIKVVIVEPGSVATPIWDTARASAEVLARTLPPQAHHVYGRAIETARRRAARLAVTGMHADVVARAVERALVAAAPKARYLVGWGARLGSAFRLLPEQLRDWFMLRRV
jgi:NAD(P)-dependent dehydrogenase (short-subunit alcohol dehydrogenase family)